MNRSREGAARFAERRQRENEAPRLRDAVPNLATLRLDVEERRGSVSVAESKHVRHVVVDHAPALFALVCGDSACKDGGHELTSQIMRNLQSGQAEFDVEDECLGSVGTATCHRVIHIHATATYRVPPTNP
jgi:hypothetical protein